MAATDIYHKHAFIPGPIGRSWCDVTDEQGHLCGRRAAHAIHAPRVVPLSPEQRLRAYLKRNGMSPDYRLDETVAEIIALLGDEEIA